MRFGFLPLLGLLALGGLASGPATAQQVSPLTGTTSATPQIPAGPGAATASPPAAGRAEPARPARKTMQQRFDEANTSKDGKLTLAQATAAKMTRVSKNFDAIDTGRKGYVTMEDIQAFNRAQRAAHKQGK